MKTNMIFTCFVALLVTGIMATTALAHEFKLGDLKIDHPWARATSPVAKSAGAFMMIKNSGTAPDRLIAVSSPIAKKVHMHKTIMENDIMKMRPVNAVDIPAGGMAALEPGGLHIMFMGLEEPLAEGDSFPLTLTFEGAGSLDIVVDVEAAGAMGEMQMETD